MSEALLVRRQGGTKLPELTNPGTADDLLFGKELIDADGNIVTGNIPTKTATTITPSTSEQTAVDTGVYTTGEIKVAGDVNLISANIKNGVSIFGITGTFEDNSDKLINRSITECINNDVTTIGSYVFYNCRSLTSVSFPVCTSIGGYAFNGCINLASVNFPACTSIASQAFRYCSSLTSANFPICANIGSSAFGGCSKLASLTLGASSVCTLYNSNVFTGTPISVSTYIGNYGSIYVPASLVNAYKSATNWTRYSSRITSM